MKAVVTLRVERDDVVLDLAALVAEVAQALREEDAVVEARSVPHGGRELPHGDGLERHAGRLARAEVEEVLEDVEGGVRPSGGRARCACAQELERGRRGAAAEDAEGEAGREGGREVREGERQVGEAGERTLEEGGEVREVVGEVGTGEGDAQVEGEGEEKVGDEGEEVGREGPGDLARQPGERAERADRRKDPCMAWSGSAWI